MFGAPFARAMAKDAFLEVWPEGRIHISDAPQIESFDFGQAGPMVMAIAANKGMGKSKAIRASLRSLPPSTTILNVTFRRSLARGAASDIPHGRSKHVVYLDEEPGSVFGARSHPRLTILINSLWRVQGEGSYEVVILDEIVSIVEMLGSEIIDPRVRLDICRSLVRILRSARIVVVADALLDEPSLQIVRRAIRTSVPACMHLFTHNNHEDYVFNRYSSFLAWRGAITASIRRGQKVVIPCMTRSFALRLRDDLLVSFPRLSILTYVADGEHDMDTHMRHIQDVWKVDVLIFSPVITAGCSFEQKHFDKCFVYAFQGTCSPRSAMQMVFRVRDLSTRQVHIFVDRSTPEMVVRPSIVPQIPPASWRHRVDAVAVHDLVLRASYIGSLSRCSAFEQSFWGIVRASGIRTRGVESILDGGSLRLATLPALSRPSSKVRLGVADEEPRSFPLDVGPRSPPDAEDMVLAGLSEGGGQRWHTVGGMVSHVSTSMLPRWVSRDMRPMWHQMMTMLWSLGMVSVGEGHVVIEGEDVPEASSWVETATIQWAYRLAFEDCEIRTRVDPLTSAQVDDVRVRIVPWVLLWAKIRRAWGGTWFVQPLRSTTFGTNMLPQMHRPHAAIIRSTGLTTMLWVSTAPSMALHELLAIEPILEIGASMWNAIHARSRVVHRLAMASIAAHAICMRDAVLRPNLVLRALVADASGYAVPRQRVFGIWRRAGEDGAWDVWNGASICTFPTLEEACPVLARAARGNRAVIVGWKCGDLVQSHLRRVRPSARVFDLALHVLFLALEETGTWMGDAMASSESEDIVPLDPFRSEACVTRASPSPSLPRPPHVVLLFGMLREMGGCFWRISSSEGDDEDLVLCLSSRVVLDVDTIRARHPAS